MRNTAVGNWEVIQSYPPVCSWCWISEAHAYLSQFESSKKVILYLHLHEGAYPAKITPLLPAVFCLITCGKARFPEEVYLVK